MTTPLRKKNNSPASKTTPFRTARVVSTGLDRSLPKSRTKGQLPYSANRNKNPRFRPGSKNSRYRGFKRSKKVVMGKDGRPRVFGPSNFHKNKKIKHDIQLPAKKRVPAALFQSITASAWVNQHSPTTRAHAAVSSAANPALPTFRRTLRAFFLPLSSRMSTASTLQERASQLRFKAQYPTVRQALALSSPLRSRVKAQKSRYSQSSFWTRMKAGTVLYEKDLRPEGLRTRRGRARPRRALTFARVKLAKQLIRKFRGTRGVKHSSVRYSLACFRWYNKNYIKQFKYPRRRRMIRRLKRRGSRYIQTTAAVLTAAARKHSALRAVSRAQRSALYSVAQGYAQLASVRAQDGATLGGLPQRQRMLARMQQRRKSRALAFFDAKSCYLSSFYSAKSNWNWLQRRKAARRLQRRISFRPLFSRAIKKPVRYRATTLFKPRVTHRRSKWVRLRRTRMFTHNLLSKAHLTTSFRALRVYKRNRRFSQIIRQHQRAVGAAPSAASFVSPQPLHTRYVRMVKRSVLKNLTAGHAVTSGQVFSASVPTLAGHANNHTVTGGVAQGAGARATVSVFSRNATLRARSEATAARLKTSRSFVNSTQQGTVAAAVRATALTLRVKRIQLLEKRTYRQRAKLRLPRVSVARREALRTNAKLFARNTLKSPQTWSGARKLLLPVSRSYTLRTRQALSSTITQSDLRPVRQTLSDYPRVWTRSPGYHETVLVYNIRAKNRVRVVRKHLRAKRRLARKVTTTTRTRGADTTRITMLLNRLSETQHRSVSSGAPLDRALFSKLELHREGVVKASRHTDLRSKALPAPGVVLPAVGRTILQIARVTPKEKKTKALRHLRSVQQMLVAERSLGAWSPQYPTRWRRWSSPRVSGMPTPRTWPSRKLQRQRAMLNAALASRGRPKRKHFDRAYGHLQFHRGSAATVGYERYRRVQRTKSKNNRWWKPTTYPMPFTNPYSRRSINAKNHVVKRLARQLGARAGEVGAVTHGIRGRWSPIALPPRLISSGSIKFTRKKFEKRRAFKARVKRERAKLPTSLQRWGIRVENYRLGGVVPPRRSLVLTRRKRTIRKLEQLFPSVRVWAKRRWEALNVGGSAGSPTSLYTEVCKKLPSAVWTALLAQCTTHASALAARKAIFDNFTAWYGLNAHAARSAQSLLAAATQYITLQLSGLQNTHQKLESSTHARLVAAKNGRFWRLRELPRLKGKEKQQPASLFDKANTRLYKRWLHGAETYLKRGRVASLPPKHGRGGNGLMTNYGRTRRRFPASGRRKQSYDSMLHAFMRRAGPSGARRVRSFKFQSLSVKIHKDYKLNTAAYAASRALRRHRLLAHRLSRTGYTSPAWRELLAFRSDSPLQLPSVVVGGSTTLVAQPSTYAQPLMAFGKRRFASLPTRLLFKRALAARTSKLAKSALTLRTQRSGLLRIALRRRRYERLFIDLKKHITRRRLPREQLPAPWRRKRIARKREQHTRYGDWSTRHFYFKKSNAIFWTMHDLEDRVPRRRDRQKAIMARTIFNEILKRAQKVSRHKWAKAGFRIKSPTRKPHRYCRKERKRRRRGRSHIVKGRRPRFHHFSERHDYARVKALSGKTTRSKLMPVRKKLKKLAAAHDYFAFTLRENSNVTKDGVKKTDPVTGAAKNLSAPAKLKTYPSTKVGVSVALTGKTLLKYSSLRLSKNLVALRRRAMQRKNKFMRRNLSALRRAIKQENSSGSAIAVVREQAQRTLLPFTVTSSSSVGATPLLFQRPTMLVIKSDAEKKRAVVWNIQSKERRYKRTAQYGEALTEFIPNLISFMVSRHAKNKSIPYNTAKKLITATYWNLRVYLNVDPFEKRLMLRDNNFTLLRTIRQAVAVMAKDQITEHVDRVRLRERFQPCRLHPAPTSDRFRLDWLRAFFPRKHALYQEDPEEYASIALTTDQVRRTLPTGYGIANARTTPGVSNCERTCRRLLRMRLSHCSPRFETMLQTVARAPLSEVDSLYPANESGIVTAAVPTEPMSVTRKSGPRKGESAKLYSAAFTAANLQYLFNKQSPTQYGLSSNRTPFFSRAFSTMSTRGLGAVVNYIARRNRLIGLRRATPTFTAVAARYRLKGRASARGRTNFTSEARMMIDAGGLDPRFLRYKSPRNRQYVVRLPVSIAYRADEDKLVKFLKCRALCENRESTPAERRLRSCRRYFYKENNPITTPLAAVRALVTARRTPTYMRAQIPAMERWFEADEYYSFPNRRQHMFVSPVAQSIRKLARRKAASLRINTLKTKTQRSILHYRAAAQRSVEQFYRPDSVLSKRPIGTSRMGRRGGRAGGRARTLLGKINERRKFHLEQVRTTTGPAQLMHKLLLARAMRASQRVRNRLGALRSNRARYSKGKARVSTYSLSRDWSLSSFSTAFYSRRLNCPVVHPHSTKIKYFRPRVFERVLHHRRLSKKCMRLQASRRRAIFDTFRPKLWHKLTSRWRKKDRLLRNWLKEVKRWFRDPWLSQTVDISRQTTRRRRSGEIAPREQQRGEIISGDEHKGFTRDESSSLKQSANAAITVANRSVIAERTRAKIASAHARGADKKVIIARRTASREAVRTVRPSLWLANAQAKRKTAEIALWRTKTRKEKDAIRLAEKEAAIARAAEGLPPLPPKKDPLKMPADYWMPSIVWKDIRRRVRRLEWRESDDVFSRRGFRNAFRFYPAERNRAPWLESLMYNRSLFSTRLREFRRRQFPKEQKKYKWLQRVRKSLFPGRTNVYIKGRRWPRLRMYNQRLHYTLFNLPDRNAARRHFKKLNGRSRTIGFVHAQEGLSNRLDNVLIHLNIAPTIFWARTVAPQGLLRVNGKVETALDFRFKAGDFIEPVWSRIHHFRHFFECPLNRNDEPKRHKRFSLSGVPRNFYYHPGIRCFTYLGNPRECDLRKSSRLQPHLFRWFRLDSV